VTLKQVREYNDCATQRSSWKTVYCARDLDRAECCCLEMLEWTKGSLDLGFGSEEYPDVSSRVKSVYIVFPMIVELYLPFP
jgi:hypothetical protein